MTSTDLEKILNEAMCIFLNFPQFMLNFSTKQAANDAQRGLFKYFATRQLTMILEYQDHSGKISLYDVEMGNDIIINVPFCVDETSQWFDRHLFESNTKVSIFCAYGIAAEGKMKNVRMADFIEGLDEAGIRNITHFIAKRI
jgi:hypothetical protein